VSQQCPKCQRALYNRRQTECGYCGAPIPENLRFTKEETDFIDKQLAEFEAERRKRLQVKDEDEKEERRRESGGLI
jgi:hypothetical protein